MNFQKKRLSLLLMANIVIGFSFCQKQSSSTAEKHNNEYKTILDKSNKDKHRKDEDILAKNLNIEEKKNEENENREKNTRAEGKDIPKKDLNIHTKVLNTGEKEYTSNEQITTKNLNTKKSNHLELDLSKIINIKILPNIKISGQKLSEQDVKDKLKEEYDELDTSKINIKISPCDSKYIITITPDTSLSITKHYTGYAVCTATTIKDLSEVLKSYTTFPIEIRTFKTNNEDVKEDITNGIIKFLQSLRIDVSKLHLQKSRSKPTITIVPKPSIEHNEYTGSATLTYAIKNPKTDLSTILKNLTDSPVEIVTFETDDETLKKEITDYVTRLLQLHIDPSQLRLQKSRSKPTITVLPEPSIENNQYTGSATLTYTIIQGDVRKDLRYILKQYHNSRIGIPSRSNSIRDSEQQIIAHLKNKLAFTLQNYNITNSIDFKVDRCKQQIKVLAKNDDCTGEVTINYSINYIGDNLIRQASEILGISQDDVLHLSKVKRAYKKKSLELHPDKNKRNEKKFKQLNYVYKTIDEALNA